MAFHSARVGKRYAVRRALRVSMADGVEMTGLLIELAAECCRISNLGRTKLRTGDRIRAELDGIRLDGWVRSNNDGLVGIRLESALHTWQLDELRAVAAAPATALGGLSAVLSVAAPAAA